MTIQTVNTLKGYFDTGKKPTEANFDDFIESFKHQGTLTSTGTSTAFVVDTGRSLTAYPNGLALDVEFDQQCGDNPQLKADDGPFENLVHPDGTQIKSGEIASGAIVQVKYDLANTRFVVQTNAVRPPNSADLASTANGKGASLIGIEDSGGKITATNVEGALAENRAAIDAIEADYLTASDLVDNANYVDPPNYGAKGKTNTTIDLVVGSAGTPDTDASPLISIQKHSGAEETSGRNTAAMFSIFKYTPANSANERAEAIFAEAVDKVGGSGSFVEGGRFHGVVEAANGSGYGVIALAGTDASVAFDYLIGVESEVSNKYADAPTPDSFDKTNYAAGFIATAGLSGTKHVDAGFATNPYATAGGKFRTGFLVTEDGVTTSAFANRAAVTTAFHNLAAVTVGLDLNDGAASYAAIKLPNGAGSVIRAKNNAGSADDNIFSYNSSDQLVLGTDADRVYIFSTLQYGTHNGITTESLSGYIEMVDSGGTTRKLGIVS